MEKNPPGDLLEFLSRFSPSVVDLFLLARDKVCECVPDATENVLSVSYTVSCGFTFTHSIKQAFLYIGAYANHVNIGFVDGASVPDPEGRLKGEGKSMRHLSFRESGPLDDPYVAWLIRQSATLAIRPPEPLPPITMISPKKKTSAAV